MTVVKFSILTLLAGGFCTLLGIGMWMGPQETPCSAQTGTTTVAVVRSPASSTSCWTAASNAATAYDVVAKAAPRCESDCDSGACTGSACSGDACPSGKCESDACDLVAAPAPAEPTACATSEPVQAVVPRIPQPSFDVYASDGSCASGACTPPSLPVPSGAFCAPGAPCPPPVYSAASVYHVAPGAGPECPQPAYSSPYGAMPATVYPAPVISTYATYREVGPQSNDQPSMEMIEAFMEEREKRYEAQLETFETVMELKLEAQAAMLKAEHEVAMAKLHAEAYVKLAGMEQALREEKALLQLVADGTLPTESLRAILAKNHANGHGSSVQPVSTAAAGCACEKCACETCKCGQPGASCVCAECECEGCACPGCEQAISTAAPACSACEASACKTSACEAKACGTKACETSACKASACETSACTKSGDCKACEAPTVVSVEACEACAKSCETCAKACGDCKAVDGTLQCDALTVSADGKTCTIVVGAAQPSCKGGECKGSACEESCKAVECEAAECPTGKCGTCDKSAAKATTESPFVCEKDGCEVEFRVDDVLSDIPYVGRLFENRCDSEKGCDEAAPVEESQR